MRTTYPMIAASALLSAVLFSACADKKFTGGTTAATPAAAAEDAKPAVETPAPTPAPVAPVEATVVSATATGNVFKNCPDSPGSNYVADLYQLPSGTQQLPDFSGMTRIKQICLKQIDIATRAFDDGFPGVDTLKEWFALNIHFNLRIEKAGLYKFRLNSDDGSKLYFDNATTPTINNDKTHSTKSVSGEIQLTAGVHAVTLPYFQGPANQIALELFWTPPDQTTENYIPLTLITRPSVP